MTNRIVYITGRKGSGKTSLAHALARRTYYDRGRVIAVAPVGGISLPGAPVIRDDDPRKWGSLRGQSCLVMPEDDETAEAAFSFAWHLQEKSLVPLLLVVDEVALYLPAAQPSANLMRIIRYGRHRRLSLITTSQRPASVHNDLIAQSDDRYLFGQSEPNDVAYLRKFTGIDPEKLSSLPNMAFYRIPVGGQVVQGVIRYHGGVPEISY